MPGGDGKNTGRAEQHASDGGYFLFQRVSLAERKAITGRIRTAKPERGGGTTGAAGGKKQVPVCPVGDGLCFTVRNGVFFKTGLPRPLSSLLKNF